jgi:tetratricopeptide (TPR) repeat protein
LRQALFLSLLLTVYCLPPAVYAAQAAEDELKKGNYQQAIAAFNARLAANRADAAAQAGLLRAYLETGRYSEAEQAAKKFLSAGPTPDVHLALGEVYAATGRYAESIEEFARAGEKASGAAKLRADLRRGEMLQMTGQEEKAREIFQSFVAYYNANQPQTAPELTLVARALTYLEKYKDANDLYLEAIAADPDYIEAHLGGGELFTSKYNYAEAADFFRDALEINPNSARAHLGVAANKRLEGGAEMMAALGRALEINPNLAEARALRAAVYLEAEDYDQAAAELAQAFKANPRSLDAHAVRAALYFLQDRQSELAGEIKTALGINPRYGALYETLSHFATINRRYAAAVEFSRKAIELSPRLWQAHLSLGIGLLRLGHEPEGRAAIETAFKGDPFNVWAKNTLDLLDTMREYRTTKRGPFIIKAAARESDVLSIYAGDLLEEASAKLSAKYRFTPQSPITVELFPNHEDFAVRALGLPGLGALGVCFGQVIALDSPSGRPIGEFNWGSTLWHEYTHVITLQMTEYRIPRWFSEGLSVYEERRGRPGWGDDWSMALMKAFADGRWFKIADLDAGFQRPNSPDDVPRAYFQASQICEFIVERYGFDAILEMLRRYRDRARTPDVLQSVLKLSEAEFDAAFKDYVQSKIGPYLKALEYGAKNQTSAQLPRQAVLEMLRAHPDDFVLNLRAGTLYKSEGDTEKAIFHLKRAIELFPYYVGPESYEQLAQLQEARGDKAAAAETLEALIRLDEDNLGALKRLVQLRTEAGDQARALEALQMAFYINPFDPAMHTMAGGIYLERKEPERAVSEFQAALALNPPNVAEANFNLARAYHALGRPADAKRSVLRALEAAPGFDKAQDLLLELVDKK